MNSDFNKVDSAPLSPWKSPLSVRFLLRIDMQLGKQGRNQGDEVKAGIWQSICRRNLVEFCLLVIYSIDNHEDNARHLLNH